MQIFQIFRILPLAIIRVIARGFAFALQQKPQSGMYWKSKVNIQLAFPELTEKQAHHMARLSVEKQCLSYAESVKCWAMPPKWSIDKIHRVHQLEVLTQALSDPKGALIITPHLGVWEMMNAWVHQYGIPTIMYKPIKHKAIDQFVLDSRQRLKANLVPTDASGVKALFKNLKQGGFSVILPDHVPDPSGGVIAPFFGIDCLTSTLASKMAQKTQCKLVGLSCFRLDNGEGYEVFCDDLSDMKLYDDDIIVAVTALNQAVEQIIRRNPTDYMWGYKRFKNNINGDDFYKKK